MRLCREKKEERELRKKEAEAAMETSRSLSRMGYAPAGRQHAQGEAAAGQKRSSVSSGHGKPELTVAEMRSVTRHNQCRDFHRGICKVQGDSCDKGLHTGTPLIQLRSNSTAGAPPAKK